MSDVVLSDRPLRYVSQLVTMELATLTTDSFQFPKFLGFEYVTTQDERVPKVIQDTRIDTIDFPEIPVPPCRKSLSVLAYLGNDLVGMLIRETDHNDASTFWITYIGVVPSARRRGIASALIRNEMYGTNNYKANVDSRNTPAIRLYEKCGFREISRQEVYLKEPAHGDE